MYFTKEDYTNILQWLMHRTVRDSELPPACPLDGTESISILQDNRNRVMKMYDFARYVAKLNLPDFYNVTSDLCKPFISLKEAISSVPVEQRKLGLVVTYHNEHGNWEIVQFSGASVNQWDSLNYWNNLIYQALDEFILYPDEEDITGVRDGNRTFLKFKDREYNPEDFSGLGRVILRKNLVGTQACSIDDEDHYANILTQEMINEENTVYIIQYDFDLNNKNLSIPKGSVLWFQGGSLNNGTIFLQETPILGAFEFSDMGDVKLFGKFNTGQIMTFSDDSYLSKDGCYFTETTKQSSASPTEDPKQDREVFYCISSNAYNETSRQELRWWNGTEWVLILDITDYNEIKSIIADLIDKHNAEMSACYQYFKKRCHDIEVRVSEAESRLDNHDTAISNINSSITDIQNDITNISGNINNITQDISRIESSIENISSIVQDIDNIIQSQIENYFQEHVITGANSITVNGSTYTPDQNGNITLPDYPTPTPSTPTELQKLKFTGAVSAEYDGTEEVTVNIPTGGGSTEVADKVAHKLIFEGAVSAEYDGSEEIRVTIPNSSGGGTPETPSVEDLDLKALTITNHNGTSSTQFNCKEDKTVTIDKIRIKSNPSDSEVVPYDVTGSGVDALKSYDLDVLGSDNVVDLTNMNFGTNVSPIILFNGHYKRNAITDRIWNYISGNKHPFIKAFSVNSVDDSCKITLHKVANGTLHIGACVAVATDIEEKPLVDTTGGRYKNTAFGVQCGAVNNSNGKDIDIYIHGWGPSGGAAGQSNSGHIGQYGGHILGFNVILVGYITF